MFIHSELNKTIFVPFSNENISRNVAEVRLSKTRHTINLLTIIKVIVYAFFYQINYF